ncbi:MAG: indole-3-glycerol phosphate synthase TrpC [Eubacteriaceae bacterium]
MILDKIVAFKREQLKTIKKIIPIDELMSKINKKQKRDFANALIKSKDLAIISEIKKASPSKGIIMEDFDPENIAEEYEKSNVDAISVLTETEFFKGSNEYLTSANNITTVPILRKDFIIDPYQIYEAKAIGADAILLIAAILMPAEIEHFMNIAEEMGMDVLVEIHNIFELETVLNCGAKIIGINNRDLNTFEVDLKTTGDLVPHIPKEKIVVSESGIKTKGDMDYLKDLGIDAVLIGESFMKAPSIIGKIQELRS